MNKYITRFDDIDIMENIPKDAKDGQNIINLFKPKTELGKLLDLFTINKNKTKFLNLEFYSTKSLMDYLRLEDYKEEWLHIRIHKNSLQKEISNLKYKNIKSYWGIVCLYLIQKIKEDKTLEDMLKNNELPFNMYKDNLKEVLLFGSKKFTVKTKMVNFNNYCKCITLISNIIKNNDFANTVKVRNILKGNFPTLEDDIDNLIK